MPEFDRSDLIMVCMKDGKFLQEEGDGHATWINWVDSPIYAKIFHPRIVYGEVPDWGKEALARPIANPPSYYQKWPEIPDGARMVKIKLVMAGWLKEAGPIQPKKELPGAALVKKWLDVAEHGVSDYAIDNPCGDDFK